MTYQARKGKFGHEQVCVGLITANLFEREGAGTIAALLGLWDGVTCFREVSVKISNLVGGI